MCIEFANESHTTILDTVLEKALLQLIISPEMKDREFIITIVLSKHSIKAGCLNNINLKLLENNKENCALSLFNLAVNNVFPNIKENEIELTSKQMKSLIIEQQQKM